MKPSRDSPSRGPKVFAFMADALRALWNNELAEGELIVVGGIPHRVVEPFPGAGLALRELGYRDPEPLPRQAERFEKTAWRGKRRGWGRAKGE